MARAESLQLGSARVALTRGLPLARISHDQNFKNLILDYPRQALAFFAPEEAPASEDDVEIVPLRQEQLPSSSTSTPRSRRMSRRPTGGGIRRRARPWPE